MPTVKSYHEYSDEVREFYFEPTNFIIRWGMTILLCLLFVFLIASYFVKYPEVLQATVNVTTRQPPVTIVCNSGGKIQDIYISEKQDVKKGDKLFVLENPANTAHVMSLVEKLNRIRPLVYTNSLNYTNEFTENYSLGDIQQAYAVFMASIRRAQVFFTVSSLQFKIIQQAKNKLSMYDRYAQYSSIQSDLMKEDTMLAHMNYLRDSLLLAQNVNSQMNFEESKRFLIQKRNSYYGALSGQVQTNMSKADQQKYINEMTLQHTEAREKIFSDLKTDYENLLGAIEIWQKRYMFISPIDGKASFYNQWTVGQTLKPGEELMSIVPANSSDVIGRMMMPTHGSAKVKIGQSVNIKLMNYPPEEYGMLIGTISSISITPYNNNMYYAEVKIPSSLKTTYGKTIDLRQQMAGSAEVIIDNKSLLERIFNKLTFIFSKK